MKGKRVVFEKKADFVAAMRECVNGRFVTLTRGEIGKPNARYALGWLPLDEEEKYTQAVRERHAQNMAFWGGKEPENLPRMLQ